MNNSYRIQLLGIFYKKYLNIILITSTVSEENSHIVFKFKYNPPHILLTWCNSVLSGIVNINHTETLHKSSHTHAYKTKYKTNS